MASWPSLFLVEGVTMASSQVPDGPTFRRPSPRKLVTYGKASRRCTLADTPRTDSNAPQSGNLLSPVHSEKDIPTLAVSSHRLALQTKAKKPDRPTGTSQALARGSSLIKTSNKERPKDDEKLRKRKHYQTFTAMPVKSQPPNQRKQRESHYIVSRPASNVKDIPVELKGPMAKSAPIAESTSSGTLSSTTKTTPNQSPHLTASSSPSKSKLQDQSLSNPTLSASLVQKRRPRLIDALAAQKIATSESDMSDSEQEGRHDDKTAIYSMPITQSPHPTISRDSRSTQRFADPAQRKKIKFTYSQSRSNLGESQNSELLQLPKSDLGIETLPMESQGLSSPAAFDFNEDDEDDDDPASTKFAIKSVHELRRAGANSRFSDEMEDLLSRTGTPGQSTSTMRRNALFELAQKLETPNFAQQFRDHSTRNNIANDIGKEEDAIAGFALMVILVALLSSVSAPHLLQKLIGDGLGYLLNRLLYLQEDIDLIASQRNNNMSRTSRATLHHIKTSLLQTEIWHGFAMTVLSPRTMALQLLNILVRCADASSVTILAGHSDEGLYAVANRYTNTKVEGDIDFILLTSVLEAQSSLTTNHDEGISDMERWSHIVAAFLGRILNSWLGGEYELASTTLKLAINTTNTSGGAMAFDNQFLLSELSTCICGGFSKLQDAITHNRLEEKDYDGLLLLLGVAINIFEHCCPARDSLDEKSQARLVQLYSETQALAVDVSILIHDDAHDSRLNRF